MIHSSRQQYCFLSPYAIQNCREQSFRLIRWLILCFSAILLHPVSAIAEEPYLRAPEIVVSPGEDYALETRRFQGIPSLAIAPEGRLWATWYAGSTRGENKHNYVVLADSIDGGETWREQLVIDPDGQGPVRAFDPQIWRSPDGRLWVFWAQGYEGKQKTTNSRSGVWTINTENPGAASVEWSHPQRLCDGVMMGKPLVLSDGTWALPVSFWHRREADSAGFVVSDDRGQTWRERGAADVPPEMRDHDEHMVVERKDGTLWMWLRIRSGLGHSVSTDGGRTWSTVAPSPIPHARARFFVRRLDSGNLLLVRHDPANGKFATRKRKGTRSHLKAYLSKDDGETWIGGLLLDKRKNISYPDGQQASDGKINIVYDYSRTGKRQIFFASFREEDAAAGEAVSGDVRLRQLVSSASGGGDRKARTKKPEPTSRPRDNADGMALGTPDGGAFEPRDFATAPFRENEVLFSDRPYRIAEAPAALDGASFLQVPLDGEKQLTCAQAGTLYLLTPRPDRNDDSQSPRLKALGFEKVALPEFSLFDTDNPGNLCTLYQKKCAAGETFAIGKWAVPVFFE